jgi:DNA-directed RNA polymerase specialized sigma24 family protein
MNVPASIVSMTEHRQISEIIAEQRSRLRNFIRRRVPDPSDLEDILQEVFYELVEANRLLMVAILRCGLDCTYERNI